MAPGHVGGAAFRPRLGEVEPSGGRHGEDQDVYLTVAAYNERAKGFYARHGFVFTGQHGEDQLAIDGVVMPELEMVRMATAPVV